MPAPHILRKGKKERVFLERRTFRLHILPESPAPRRSRAVMPLVEQFKSLFEQFLLDRGNSGVVDAFAFSEGPDLFRYAR